MPENMQVNHGHSAEDNVRQGVLPTGRTCGGVEPRVPRAFPARRTCVGLRIQDVYVGPMVEEDNDIHHHRLSAVVQDSMEVERLSSGFMRSGAVPSLHRLGGAKELRVPPTTVGSR